jgi:PAS domain S-box-containing protein
LQSVGHKQIPRHLLAVFIFVVAAACALIYYYYETQKTQIRERIENELVAIANLKADQIINWRKERLGDAETISNNSFIIPDVRRFLKSGADTKTRARIVRWMKSFKRSDQYMNIYLVDPSGNIRLSTSGRRLSNGRNVKGLILEAGRAKSAVFSEIHEGKGTGKLHQDLVAPLISGESKDAVYEGYIILQINPDDFIYPLLKTWPASSRTAETMLARREGDEVVILNSSGYENSRVLRLPVENSSILYSFAALDNEGLFSGKDYRGMNVLAAAKIVSGSPWRIIAKVDADEIFTPIRELGWRLAFLIIGLILSTAGSIALIWRNQAAMYYRAQYESELNRVALLRHYEPLTRHANDSIMLFDSDGNIIEANSRSSSMLGYPLEELLHMNVRTIGTTCALLDMDELGKKLSVSEEKGLMFESEYVRKDGSALPVEVSLRAFEIEGRHFFQTIIRDITERKKGELRISAMNSLLKLFMKKTSRSEYLESVINLLRLWSGCGSAGIRLLDRNGCIRYESQQGFSRAFLDSENLVSVRDHQCTCIRVVLGKPDVQDIKYLTPHGSFKCDNLEEMLRGLSETERGRYRGACFIEGFKSIVLAPIRYQDRIVGVIHLVDERPGVVSDEALEMIESMSPLIGEAIFRFATEEALRLSEEHYRSLIESSSDCIYQLTLDGDYLSMNSKMAVFLGGPDSAAFIGSQFVNHVAGNNETVLMAISMAAGGDATSVRYKSAVKGGRDVWWDTVLSPISDIDGKVVSILGISRDITERIESEEELRLSHAQLRNLSAHLQSITEEERTRIAREVHDELGQVLTALKIETSWLAKRLPQDQHELTDKTAVMIKLIDNVIQSVKRICTELRPTLLDHLGISAAIEWQAEEFRKRTGLICELQLFSTSANKEVSTVLFRVLQETLTNITRHAEATKVRVLLREDEGTIIMKITDNGKGMPKENLRKPQSFGLLGMRERVHSIGGRFGIRGLRGRGTTVKIEVPARK